MFLRICHWHCLLLTRQKNVRWEVDHSNQELQSILRKSIEEYKRSINDEVSIGEFEAEKDLVVKVTKREPASHKSDSEKVDSDHWLIELVDELDMEIFEGEIEQCGRIMMTAETLLFILANDAKNPYFKVSFSMYEV